MKSQLMERGMGESVFEPGDGREIRGPEMEKLCRALSSLEDSLLALERRGVSLRAHAMRQDPESGKLPVYHVFVGHREQWFASRSDLDAFIEEEEKKTGSELKVTDRPATDGNGDTNGDTNGESDDADLTSQRLHIVELHEVRTINTALADLREMNFDIQSLIPQERTGIEEPRYVLRRGENEIGIEDLRGLLAAVRAAGEKGLQVTRFKGLGEMNAEELRETTLDPANRTLLQVTMNDVGAADDLFRILMGDKVEPRREFIEKHALEVRNLDE